MPRKILRWKNKNKSEFYKKGYDAGFYKVDIYYRMRILQMNFPQAVAATKPTRSDYVKKD